MKLPIYNQLCQIDLTKFLCLFSDLAFHGWKKSYFLEDFDCKIMLHTLSL